MADATEKKQAPAAAKTTEEKSASLLDQAVSVTKQTAPDRVADLLSTFTDAALKGTLTWDKNLTKTIQEATKAIDEKVSKQLAAIMHAEKFTKLEGTWRGLQYMVKNTICGNDLKIRVLNAPKKDLLKDFKKSLDFDQSELFKKLYEAEFGTPGGEPYGLLVGDYTFGNNPDDVDFLESVSHVAAAAFCPFIAAADSSVLSLDSWTELAKPKDLQKIMNSPECLRWNSLRNSEDSRFVSLVMPRVLARLPYGAKTKSIEEFDFEETESDAKGNQKALPHEEYCWMNAAYVMGVRMTASYADYGWCTSIRGAESGGKVEGLPAHAFMSDDGDMDLKCPSEIGITDRREAELSNLGFLPLCHYKNTDYSVFFGAQTIQKPIEYDTPEATANAAIGARLPFIMATSRFAHYLKVMARDKIGSFQEASDLESWLNKWILQYVNTNPNVGAHIKAKYPLAEAKIEVKEIPGKPGSYNAVAWLRPWMQLEELTTSLRLVASIPEKS